MKKTTLFFFAAALAASSSIHAEWKYGVGAGVGVFDIDGDLSLSSFSGEIEYDSGDMESAYVLQAYAATGKWTFRTSVASLEVEANQNIAGDTDLNFERMVWDLSAAYMGYQSGSWTIAYSIGVRGVSHEVSVNNTSASFDNDWTDIVIGTSASYALNTKWLWNSAIEAGFGGTEGSFGLNTGLTWRFAPQWSVSSVLSWSAAEYEEGNSGSANYYFYDANETKLGFAVLYHF